MNWGTLFVALFMGHIAGDYWLQNDWMARSKINFDREGWLACLVHCVVYTIAVGFSLTQYGFHVGWWAAFFIFLSHFPIDKWSLGKKWMKMYGQSMDPKTNPFVPCVYIAVDNGFHIFLMLSWLGAMYHIK